MTASIAAQVAATLRKEIYGVMIDKLALVRIDRAASNSASRTLVVFNDNGAARGKYFQYGADNSILFWGWDPVGDNRNHRTAVVLRGDAKQDAIALLISSDRTHHNHYATPWQPAA